MREKPVMRDRTWINTLVRGCADMVRMSDNSAGSQPIMEHTFFPSISIQCHWRHHIEDDFNWIVLDDGFTSFSCSSFATEFDDSILGEKATHVLLLPHCLQNITKQPVSPYDWRGSFVWFSACGKMKINSIRQNGQLIYKYNISIRYKYLRVRPKHHTEKKIVQLSEPKAYVRIRMRVSACVCASEHCRLNEFQP